LKLHFSFSAPFNQIEWFDCGVCTIEQKRNLLITKRFRPALLACWLGCGANPRALFKAGRSTVASFNTIKTVENQGLFIPDFTGLRCGR
jgi:hypothetical protein